MNKIFGGIEQSTAAATHPKGKHDLSELDAITKQSLERLYNFQHSDGGWGWWKNGDSDHFMTAYVLWGMTLARQAGIDVKQDAAARAAFGARGRPASPLLPPRRRTAAQTASLAS
jgi:uncharacterized protein YfaS (alpha-2-macroglobulin family)